MSRENPVNRFGNRNNLAPDERPYSAWEDDVTSLNSPTESSGILETRHYFPYQRWLCHQFEHYLNLFEHH